MPRRGLTHLTSVGPRGRPCTAGRDAGAGGAVGSGEMLRVACILLGIVMSWLRLTLGIMAHVVALAIGGILRISGAGLRNGGIYRYFRVRFHVRRVMMVILGLAIWFKG